MPDCDYMYRVRLFVDTKNQNISFNHSFLIKSTVNQLGRKYVRIVFDLIIPFFQTSDKTIGGFAIEQSKPNIIVYALDISLCLALNDQIILAHDGF